MLAAEARLEKLREQHDELQSRVTAAQLESTQARANSESDARQLAETLARLSALQERCTTDGAQMQAHLAQAVEALHTSEIQRAGVCSENEHMKAELTTLDSRCRQTDEHRNQLEAQLQKNATQLGEARTDNGVLSNKLTDATARFADLQRRYNEELPALRTNLESAVAKCHETEVQLALLQGQLKSVKHPASSSPRAPKSQKNTEKRAPRSGETSQTSQS
jgi:chromosome segregation ATPase